ncbi:MAG: sulfur carrier protein ThiS adenylyltransferase ThiF [Candidatus Omnitrophica bacterium]|nr:sulfur carrier protein ThiS adenylyltransferase ThiF [Candidatus Omnitrophota bacterium]
MNSFENNLLKYLTKKQLGEIQRVKLGIGGAGGLGSNIAIMLIRSGFRNLEVIDKDKIDFSNLNRQQYFFKEIGKPKVKVLKKRLLDINPSSEIKIYQKEWSAKDGNLYFVDCDIVIEAFDNAKYKRDFVEFYQDKAKFVISGNGLAGISGNFPLCMRRVGNIFFAGDGKTGVDKNNPPLAPRVTLCAALMAETALKLALQD